MTFEEFETDDPTLSAMPWLQRAADAPSAFEGVLGLRPELINLYRAFRRGA
jgi:hypothetical protein